MRMRKLPHHRSRQQPSPCRFCEIATGNGEAEIVFEDSISIAFLDERPLFEGHCLLITRAHYQTFLDLPRDLIGPLFLNAQHLAEAVQSRDESRGNIYGNQQYSESKRGSFSYPHRASTQGRRFARFLLASTTIPDREGSSCGAKDSGFSFVMKMSRARARVNLSHLGLYETQ